MATATGYLSPYLRSLLGALDQLATEIEGAAHAELMGAEGPLHAAVALEVQAMAGDLRATLAGRWGT